MFNSFIARSSDKSFSLTMFKDGRFVECSLTSNERQKMKLTLSRMQKLFCVSILISAVVVVREFYRCEFLLPVKQIKISRGDDSFLSDWCRLQKSRVDWEGLAGSCLYKMTWEHREVGSKNRTDAKRSFISKWEIKPQGEFSRFYIQSVTSDGALKKTGGDSWRVHIRQGPASLAPMVVDHDDGTYEVMFLALEPGNYSTQVSLDYTLCDGYRDPPADWYIKGDIQGHKQAQGMLGYTGDDFIKAPLQYGIPVTFYIAQSTKTNGLFKYILPSLNRSSQAPLSQLSCNVDCALLWNGFGRWLNEQWRPYLPEDNENKEQSRNSKLRTLMVYGDSIGVHYYKLATRRRLCKEIFHTCNKKYMWTYDVELKGNDSSDFNQSLVLEAIKQVLTRPNMKVNRSVLLFNIGIHYSLSLNFTTYQRLIDSVIKMLKQETDKEDKSGLSNQALTIWRSSTAIEAENFGKTFWGENLTEWRFHTNPRVHLFHTYATGAMCMAGIPVLDVYPLTAAWPKGAHDSIHYIDKVMEPTVRILERYLTENVLKT